MHLTADLGFMRSHNGKILFQRNLTKYDSTPDFKPVFLIILDLFIIHLLQLSCSKTK